MIHPSEFRIISSTSNTPTLKRNCIASMLETVRTESIVMVITLLSLLNSRDVKKPKGIKVTILATRFINII